MNESWKEKQEGRMVSEFCQDKCWNVSPLFLDAACCKVALTEGSNEKWKNISITNLHLLTSLRVTSIPRIQTRPRRLPTWFLATRHLISLNAQNKY